MYFHFNGTTSPYYVTGVSQYKNAEKSTNLVISKELRIVPVSDALEMVKIINGEPVKEGFHQVLQLLDSKTMKTVGTGNILGGKLGLSAAHVLTKSKTEQYYGFAGSYISKEGIPNPVVSIKPMPGFVEAEEGRDLVLI
uniref:Uncharacterized protein n=1 Tax=Panagrolaimus davidi TaxID=227884 RepID=A0A914PF76_9BILA